MNSDRRQVSQEEREAISRALQSLLAQRDESGRKVWSQNAIGARLGVSQESARRALVPNGVGPAVRDAIPDLMGMTMEEILQKFGAAHEGTSFALPRAVAVAAVVSGKRYANREQAITHLAQDGAGAREVIEEAANRAAVALDATEDRSVVWWIDSIRPFIKSARRGDPSPGLGARGMEDED